jgi:hypothetical protein
MSSNNINLKTFPFSTSVTKSICAIFSNLELVPGLPPGQEVVVVSNLHVGLSCNKEKEL